MRFAEHLILGRFTMTFKMKPCLFVALAIGVLSLPYGAYAQNADDTVGTMNQVNSLLPSDEELNAPQMGGAPAAVTPSPGQALNNTSDQDVFYDADALVPSSEMARRTPRNVDPNVEPASKWLIVTKNHAASSKQASLVSANRALKLGRDGAALEMFEVLLKKNSRDVNALMGRAVALQNLECYDEAIMAYDAVLDVRPDYKDARINKMGLIAQRYPAVALRQLTEMYQNNPDDVGVIAQLALTHAQLGDAQQALNYLGVVASKEPTNALHLYNMAIVADRAGMKKEAIEFYENALEVDTIYSGGRSLPRDTVFTRLAQLR